MPHRLIAILLLAVNLSFSQLSVSNDNYVFVSDQYIFVEDDVNLEDSNSRIFLRDEGQLIQGSGTSSNSGVGELSVYQDGNVGAHEYNYWCSPIGSKDDTSTNNPFGISLLNDIIALTSSIPATYNTSTSYNGTSNPLNIEPYWIWKYPSANGLSGWVHVRSNTIINPGEGFTMKGTTGSNNMQNYDFRGKPNNGTISVNVENEQITLVGNPYPSAIDAVAYIHDINNSSVIDGSLYFWEQDLSANSHRLDEYSGGYASYTISSDGLVETYVPATFSTYDNQGNINGEGNGSPSGKRPRRYIPIGQGFMVAGTASGTVQAKNIHRVFEKESSSNSEFFKSSNSKLTTIPESNFSVVPEDYKRFRLNIDFNGLYTRQLMETFHYSATEGFDYGIECPIKSEFILSTDAYLKSERHIYIAEALPFSEDLTIPVVIKVANKSMINISLLDIQNFSNSPIYLYDNEENTYTELTRHPFHINLEPGLYTNRFEIRFNKNTLSSLIISETRNLIITQNNRSATLKILNPNNFEIKSIEIFDVLGKRVLRKSKIQSRSEYRISTNSLNDGIYITNVILSNNQSINKKIIVTNNY